MIAAGQRLIQGRLRYGANFGPARAATFSAMKAWGRTASTQRTNSGSRLRSSSSPRWRPAVEKGWQGGPPWRISAPLYQRQSTALTSPLAGVDAQPGGSGEGLAGGLEGVEGGDVGEAAVEAEVEAAAAGEERERAEAVATWAISSAGSKGGRCPGEASRGAGQRLQLRSRDRTAVARKLSRCSSLISRPGTRAPRCRACIGSSAGAARHQTGWQIGRPAAESVQQSLDLSGFERLDDQLAQTGGMVSLDPLPALEVAGGIWGLLSVEPRSIT